MLIIYIILHDMENETTIFILGTASGKPSIAGVWAFHSSFNNASIDLCFLTDRKRSKCMISAPYRIMQTFVHIIKTNSKYRYVKLLNVDSEENHRKEKKARFCIVGCGVHKRIYRNSNHTKQSEN